MPATAISTNTKTIRLITMGGNEIERFEIPANMNYPRVVIFGVLDAEKVFLQHKGGEYCEISFLHAPMPYLTGY